MIGVERERESPSERERIEIKKFNEKAKKPLLCLNVFLELDIHPRIRIRENEPRHRDQSFATSSKRVQTFWKF